MFAKTGQGMTCRRVASNGAGGGEARQPSTPKVGCRKTHRHRCSGSPRIESCRTARIGLELLPSVVVALTAEPRARRFGTGDPRTANHLPLISCSSWPSLPRQMRRNCVSACREVPLLRRSQNHTATIMTPGIVIAEILSMLHVTRPRGPPNRLARFGQLLHLLERGFDLARR